jgi:hypothetical protein
MNRMGLEEDVPGYVGIFRSLDSLLRARKRLPLADDDTAIALCGLHAAAGAYRILVHIRPLVDIEPEFSFAANENSRQMPAVLPTYETVHRAANDLTLAISSKDKPGIIRACREMGIASLCPGCTPPFPQMERFALGVGVRAQAIPLVELSLFSVNSSEYEQARRYVQRARSHNPRSLELYDLCIAEGLIALNDGRVNDAIRCLAGSVDACLEDVHSALECSMLAPNLELAERLLEHGERIEVLRHLSDCLDLWVRFKAAITDWMETIERGDIPNFRAAESVSEASRPAWKLRIQWLRACSLKTQRYSSSPARHLSRDQVLAARKSLLSRHQARSDEFVEKKNRVS